MTTLFLLQHESIFENSSDVKIVGIYESKDLAEKALSKLSRLPGFSEYPDGFSIDTYDLNRDYWSEGYESVK